MEFRVEPTALAYSAEVASATKAGRPWHLSTRFVGRNPLKRTLLAYSAEAVASAAKAGRQGYGGYPPRIHPRVNTRGFLRSRVRPAPPKRKSYSMYSTLRI